MPDIVTGKTFVDGEKGITATKMNQIISQAVIQPSFVTSKPSSSTLDPTDQMLEVKGAGTYATITGSQLISSVSAQVDATPQIYSVRLRSFNAAGNCNFECRQRNVGNVINNPASGVFIEDRWASQNGGNVNPGFQVISVAGGPGSAITIPGMTFPITTGLIRISVGTQKVSLSAGDNVGIQQTLEGPRFRELSNDVHSISVLARSTVSNLSFGVALRDPTGSRSLTKLCTLGAASTWVLFTLPNLPIWPSAGTFTSAIGSVGYAINVTVACGSTMTSPSNDIWNTGNYVGATGQGNLLASAAGSYVDIAFIQHEPGAVCTTLMDCPFGQNYDGDFGCLRYFQKSYDYATVPGSGGVTSGLLGFASLNATASAYGTARFHKPMAKPPTVTLYNWSTGAANSIQDGAGTNHGGASAGNIGASGFPQINYTTATSAPMVVYAHYTADTGW